jgi:hypothetical protein
MMITSTIIYNALCNPNAYARLYVCMYACVCVRMCACMYVCLARVCMHVDVRVCVPKCSDDNKRTKRTKGEKHGLSPARSCAHSSGPHHMHLYIRTYACMHMHACQQMHVLYVCVRVCVMRMYALRSPPAAAVGGMGCDGMGQRSPSHSVSSCVRKIWITVCNAA